MPNRQDLHGKRLLSSIARPAGHSSTIPDLSNPEPDYQAAYIAIPTFRLWYNPIPSKSLSPIRGVDELHSKPVVQCSHLICYPTDLSSDLMCDTITDLRTSAPILRARLLLLFSCSY